MAEYIRISKIKEKLTDCPICFHEYDELEHLPRRMPCCVQSICHSCLEKIWKNNQIPCPLCRHEQELLEGVTSLPVESLMLKILDHLNIQRGLRLPCTDCPDGNEAQYRCDDCCVFLCEECHKAHARLPPTRDHKTVTIEEIKERPVESFRKRHQCKDHHQTQQFYCRTCKQVICVACTVVNHKTKNHDVVSVEEAHRENTMATDDVIFYLDQKAGRLKKKLKHLEEKKTQIHMSRERATEDVNRTIDNLVELLQTRRVLLLSDVDMKSDKELKVTDEAHESTTTLLAKVKSSTEYTRKMRERADKVEDLQLMVSSTDTLNNMLQETAQDVKFDRTGVTFAPVQVMEMQALIDVLGSVRTVTFTPAEKPAGFPADEFYNAVTMIPDELPQVTGFDHVFSERERLFISPHLEFDHNTASDDVQISSGMVSNIRPDPAPQDTGCRLQSERRALTLRPLPLRRGLVTVFSTRVVFSVKQLREENKLLWETGVTSFPEDSNYSQITELSVGLLTCRRHKQQLCLQVWYDSKLLTDVPLIQNQIGGTTELHFCMMIDRVTNKIHVVDINTVKVVTIIPDVTLDRPLWLLMYVASPSYTEMKSELISGREFNVTPEIKQLLISLTK